MMGLWDYTLPNLAYLFFSIPFCQRRILLTPFTHERDKLPFSQTKIDPRNIQHEPRHKETSRRGPTQEGEAAP